LHGRIWRRGDVSPGMVLSDLEALGLGKRFLRPRSAFGERSRGGGGLGRLVSFGSSLEGLPGLFAMDRPTGKAAAQRTRRERAASLSSAERRPTGGGRAQPGEAFFNGVVAPHEAVGARAKAEAVSKRIQGGLGRDPPFSNTADGLKHILSPGLRRMGGGLDMRHAAPRAYQGRIQSIS
jgi:hypothetical protein